MNFHKKKTFAYYLGNALIALSMAGFLYIFYPLIGIYLNPPKVESLVNRTGTYITINKINAQAVISENVNPLDANEYQKVLKNSVAHALGTSLPGNPGTTFIFAHSSGPPWEQTRYNTIFLRLNELNPGDGIELQRMGKVFKYTVKEKKEVMPTEVKFLENTGKDQLILQTCTPIGTDLRRLLIFADPS